MLLIFEFHLYLFIFLPLIFHSLILILKQFFMIKHLIFIHNLIFLLN